MGLTLKLETAEDALRAWDAGDVLPSVSMGGIGPGYEQCIQIVVFEIIRDQLGRGLPTEENARTWADATLSRINRKLGISSAQWCAARNLACLALQNGWQRTIDSAPVERRIMVSRDFPRWP